MGTNKILIAGLAGLLFSVTGFAGSFAQDVDPAAVIKERQDLMRSIGQQMRSAGNLTGQAAIDQAKVFIADFEKLPTLFPEGTETGGETEAAPAIWSDRAGFEAVNAKAVAQAQAVLAAAEAGDTTAYTAALRGFGPTCGECHQTYRAD